ncbi:uncharacterized protein [Haliotis asinina]|uniref:uncharacterized protein n=1 Tax=Haliotis asinina TaxID=109174 RepID=UPI0035324BB4
MSIGSDGSPAYMDSLLEKYKTSGYFHGPVIQSVRLSVMFQCYELCGYFPRCASISYNPGRRQCHLHNATGPVVPDRNWMYIKTILRIVSSRPVPPKIGDYITYPRFERTFRPTVVAPVLRDFHRYDRLEGNTSHDSTEKNTAHGTLSTYHVAEYPETRLSAALKIETSLSDTLKPQVDNGQYLTQSPDTLNAGPITPTMILTYSQVDKFEHMATSSVEIKATSSSALTLPHKLMDMTETASKTMTTDASDIAPIKATSSSALTSTYQLTDMTETASKTMNTGASDIGTSLDTQGKTTSDHTSAESSVVTALSLVVSNTDLVDAEAPVAIDTRPLPDLSTATLSPEMMKRSKTKHIINA